MLCSRARPMALERALLLYRLWPPHFTQRRSDPPSSVAICWSARSVTASSRNPVLCKTRWGILAVKESKVPNSLTSASRRVSHISTLHTHRERERESYLLALCITLLNVPWVLTCVLSTRPNKRPILLSPDQAIFSQRVPCLSLT
jgi:hypothetical protein